MTIPFRSGTTHSNLQITPVMQEKKSETKFNLYEIHVGRIKLWMTYQNMKKKTKQKVVFSRNVNKRIFIVSLLLQEKISEKSFNFL